MNIIIFVVILLVLVIVHEFGHFWSAKRFGIRVDEFGFGFPPKLFGIKKGETEYTFNALPIGGFVKIFGENPDEESISGPDSARSFVNKPKWQQAVVLVAGVLANFILAWFLFSVAFMSGMPTSVGNEKNDFVSGEANLTVISVLKNSPAEKAGLKTGQKLLQLSDSKGQTIKDLTPQTFSEFVSSHPEETLTLSYKGSDNTINTTSITPEKKSDTGKGFVGISMDRLGVVKYPFFRAFYEGFKMNFIMIGATASGLYHFVFSGITGQGSLDGVAGPVGMAGIVGDAYKFGFVYLLSFVALISVNLGVLNLVPFPALDGGRLLFLLIEKIKGSRLSPKFANTANTLGFLILIGLMILVTYHDIAKLF